MLKIYKNSVQTPKLKIQKEAERMSWVNVVDPTDKEIKRLKRLLTIPDDVIQDSLDVFELPRISKQGNNIVIILRAPVNENGLYTTLPLTIIINPTHIATISPQRLAVTEDIANRVIKVTTTQQSNFLIQTALRVIHYYQRYTMIITKTVQREKAMLNKIDQAEVHRLIETEEILNNFIASLTPTITVLKKLLHGQYINLYPQDRELIDDLLVDGEQVLDLSNTNLRTVKNIRDGYTTVLSIRLNQTMKLLTYLTALLTVPLIVANVYGMNIPLPLADSPHAFSILTSIMIALMLGAIASFVWFRKRY